MRSFLLAIIGKRGFLDFGRSASDIIAPKAQSSVRSSVGIFWSEWQEIDLLRAFASGGVLTQRATPYSPSVRVVIEASAIAGTVAGSECANSNCGHLAADTRPLQ
jgi:hypothetical protein